MLAPIGADERYSPFGRVLPMLAYDAGHPPPARPVDGPGTDLVRAGLDEVTTALEARSGARASTLRWSRQLLAWLLAYPGEDWEQRWLASGADKAPRSWAAAAHAAGVVAVAGNAVTGCGLLIQARLLRPSYSWLLNTHFAVLFDRFPQANDPHEFARLRELPLYRRAGEKARHDAIAALVRVMIRTGKRLPQLTGDDLLGYADLVKASGRHRREHLAWELMVELGPFAGEPPTLRSAWTAKSSSRQYTAHALIGRYDLPPHPVVDLLTDYLTEIRPRLDYGTWTHVARSLGVVFWRTILEINPGQQDLRLTAEVAAQWRERLMTTTQGLPRSDYHAHLINVRAFYRDVSQWALADPARWARWAAPCPIRRIDVQTLRKAKRQRTARMQERTRTLTPLLPQLVETAARRRDWSGRLLTAALATPHGEPVTVDGVTYVRHDPPKPGRWNRDRIWLRDPDGGLLDATRLEADGFWAWALIETLRHSGARIEEVLELTQLSLRHHTPATTGTLVPLLHITPSKADRERLIPMSPELVQVLLAVQRRARGDADAIPLAVRYDPAEKTHGPALPHLFARRVGARQEVLSAHYVRTVLIATADAAGLRDGDAPIAFTPHDFRRLFTTEAVGAGLPLHIAAALLGHLDLDTTRGYTAVFPDEVITRHQQFITHRRTLRDAAEYRDVTADEWAEFEKHFQLRRVALGDCFRPYGSPCVHEHACVRCPQLRLDPAQIPLLDSIEANTHARIREAKGKQWLGEVAALRETLYHIGRKRDQLGAPTTRRQTPG
ncbi:phage integrase family protein [Krasilnikovia cinnamomea]|uniref:Phage integrase family protein n=1 Tax=Krasilnikovia cinnamomea TaxID=349313 RepID=A0A4V2G5Y7_9ACTN|nr:tyrosine-type recombinase/integrase [Krasilnikovia cinnamomea]RZU46596.1 phage integrase family protein [Krasilnikovia cinnamomea]